MPGHGRTGAMKAHVAAALVQQGHEVGVGPPVDYPAAMPQDLDAPAAADEQAWLSERQPYLRY